MAHRPAALVDGALQPQQALRIGRVDHFAEGRRGDSNPDIGHMSLMGPPRESLPSLAGIAGVEFSARPALNRPARRLDGGSARIRDSELRRPLVVDRDERRIA